MDLLGRLLTDHDLPLRSRVAAAIVLLYAQPLSRVVRLTIDDVIHDGDQVLLRLGEPPSPVPGPVADLLLSWIPSRDNMSTATNRDSRWLFPGRRAGQPMHPDALSALVNSIGVPTVAGRASAIREHVLERLRVDDNVAVTLRTLRVPGGLTVIALEAAEHALPEVLEETRGPAGELPRRRRHHATGPVCEHGRATRMNSVLSAFSAAQGPSSGGKRRRALRLLGCGSDRGRSRPHPPWSPCTDPRARRRAADNRAVPPARRSHAPRHPMTARAHADGHGVRRCVRTSRLPGIVTEAAPVPDRCVVVVLARDGR